MPDATRRQEPRCTASHAINGMTIQITVRLHDEQVRFLDRQVAAGETKSRAAGLRAPRRRPVVEAPRAIPHPDARERSTWRAGPDVG